jgi:hypothetical protein
VRGERAVVAGLAALVVASFAVAGCALTQPMTIVATELGGGGNVRGYVRVDQLPPDVAGEAQRRGYAKGGDVQAVYDQSSQTLALNASAGPRLQPGPDGQITIMFGEGSATPILASPTEVHLGKDVAISVARVVWCSPGVAGCVFR